MHPKAIDLWDVFAVGCIGAGFWQALQAERRRAVEAWRRAEARKLAIGTILWNRMLKHCPEGCPAGGRHAFSAN